MKCRASLLAAVVLLGLGSAATATAEDRVVEGTLVTAFCYLENGSTGEDHRECAQRCSESGAPAGVVTDDGEFVPLLAYAGMIAEQMEARVRVTGEQRDGYLWATRLEIRDGEEWVEISALPGS